MRRAAARRGRGRARPCSSPGHAPDLLARLRGHGHAADPAARPPRHRRRPRPAPAARARRRPAARLGHGRHEGRRRARASACCARWPRRAELTPRSRCCSSATRSGGPAPFGHVERFAGFDACLCFEAGELTPTATRPWSCGARPRARSRSRATGRAAHSGSAPDRGRNALLALAAAAQAVAARHDPDGPDHLTAVPTVLRSGDAFNVVPGARRALLRPARRRSRRRSSACSPRVPREVGGVDARSRADPAAGPGWTPEAATAPVLGARARARAPGRRRCARGGASDASHFAADDPAHRRRPRAARRQGAQPRRVRARGVAAPRAEVALAMIDAALAG